MTRCDRRRRDETTLIVAGSPGPWIAVIVEVQLCSASGQPQHSEVLWVKTRVAWNGDRRACAVRDFLRSFLHNHSAALVEAVERSAGPSLQKAREQQATVIARLERRDRAMLQNLPSAAHRLVQAGLFDNRALKVMRHERQVASMIIEDADLRAHHDLEALETRCATKFIAFRLGRRR